VGSLGANVGRPADLVALKAFPVLCRILTELKLLDTNVGVITLSAGVANDVVGKHLSLVSPFPLCEAALLTDVKQDGFSWLSAWRLSTLVRA
jgi:hypothetical protein